MLTTHIHNNYCLQDTFFLINVHVVSSALQFDVSIIEEKYIPVSISMSRLIETCQLDNSGKVSF